MDLDQAVIAHVLRANDIKEAISAKAEADLFKSPEGKAGWEWMVAFLVEYGEGPTEDAFRDAFPRYDLMETGNEPLDFLIKKLRERRMHNIMHQGVREVAELLKAKDSYAAAEKWVEVGMKAQEDFRPSRDVSWPRNPEERFERYQALKEFKGIDGLSTPWDTLNEATQGLHDEELIFIVARTSIGKCVALDSRVLLADGRLVEAGDVLAGAGENVVVFDEERRLFSGGRIAQRVDSGTKRVFRVSTRTGRRVKVTACHPFLTGDGWHTLEDGLGVGDHIAVPRHLPTPGNRGSMALAEILGGLLTEGNTTRAEVGFTNEDPAILAVMQEAVAEFRGELIHRPSAMPCEWHIVGNRDSRKHQKNPILRLVKVHGLYGKKSEHKVVPDVVFQFSKPVLRQFLRMVFSCDGSVYNSTSSVVEYCSASERMARDVQHLLLRFGIVGRLRFKPNDCLGAWVLEMYGVEVDRFVQRIGFIGEKAKRAAELPSVQFRASNWDSIPKTPRLEAVVGGLPFEVRKQLSEDLGKKEVYTAKKMLKNKMFSRELLAALVVRVADTGLEYLLAPDLVWDRIVGVEDLGEEPVMDIGVAGSHNFVANDMLVHNTWSELIMAHHVWLTEGKVPLVLTKEMAVYEILQRLDARHFCIPHKLLLSGRLGTEAELEWRENMGLLKQMQDFWVSGDDSEGGVSGVASKAATYRPDGGLWVDGGTFLADDRKGQSQWERVANVSKDLKGVARTLKMPVTATFQLSKRATNAKGSSDDIASADIARDADKIIGVFQTPEQYEAKEVEYRLLKNRNGPKNISWTCRFDFDLMDFHEIGSRPEVSDVEEDAQVSF